MRLNKGIVGSCVLFNKHGRFMRFPSVQKSAFCQGFLIELLSMVLAVQNLFREMIKNRVNGILIEQTKAVCGVFILIYPIAVFYS